MPEETKGNWELHGTTVFEPVCEGETSWYATVYPNIGHPDVRAVARLMRAAKEVAEALEGFLAVDPSKTYCCWCDSEDAAGGVLSHRTEKCPRLVAEFALRSAGRLP